MSCLSKKVTFLRSSCLLNFLVMTYPASGSCRQQVRFVSISFNDGRTLEALDTSRRVVRSGPQAYVSDDVVRKSYRVLKMLASVVFCIPWKLCCKKLQVCRCQREVVGGEGGLGQHEITDLSICQSRINPCHLLPSRSSSLPSFRSCHSDAASR
ncbi:hypothetical protein KCU83_g547, partial [Aureobasidium melanogenum]